jgi:hypothetical protein
MLDLRVYLIVRKGDAIDRLDDASVCLGKLGFNDRRSLLCHPRLVEVVLEPYNMVKGEAHRFGRICVASPFTTLCALPVD